VAALQERELHIGHGRIRDDLAESKGPTGNPIGIVTNITTFTGVNNSLRPDRVGNPAITGQPTPWFANSVCDPRIAGSCTSSSEFALPVSADGTFHFGSLGRNAIDGPGLGNTDFSVIKNLALAGASRLQLRLEVLNVFNQDNFGQPNRIAVPGGTAFCVISNTRFPTGDSGSARQVQLAATFLF